VNPALANVGKPNAGQNLEKLFRVVRDTDLIELGGTLVDKVLFTNEHKDEKYKTPGFPSQSQAFKIIGVRITPLILFALGASDVDGPAQAQRMAAFLELSKFSLRLEGNDVFDEYLTNFTNFDMKPALPAAGDTAYTTTRDKFNNFFKLPVPVIIAPGASFRFDFKPVEFTTEGTGTQDMLLPNSGLSNSKGYAIFFDLITTNVKERG
jgi:hypothetical protein